MKEQIKVGYIGLGRRGWGIIKIMLEMPDVKIKTICDLRQDHIDRTLGEFDTRGLEKPIVTHDYKDIINDPEIDAVLIMTGWSAHVKLAKESMLAGKYTGVEVGCVYDISECYELLDAYDKTGAPLMMLENGCYCRRELMALNMERQGLLGEVVHCKGGYHHNLFECDLFMKNAESGEVETNHYRLIEYANRNGETYPTHEFGPISKLLRINRGNRIMTLASYASKARGLKEYIKTHVSPDHPFYNSDFRQGDIVTTVLTCANGETIMLELDTTLPRPALSRNFTVRGTKGMVSEARKTVFLEGMDEKVENNDEEFYEKYDHPLHAEYAKLGPKGGHGGVDWLTIRGFVESVKNGIQTPIDIYDTLLWMSIAPLSEMSIAKGGMPVEVPDFTRGKWFKREPLPHNKYCLDEVIIDTDVPIFPEGKK